MLGDAKVKKTYQISNFSSIYLKNIYIFLLFLNFENKYLISGSDDFNIIIWNAQSGSNLRTLKGHTDWVNCLVIIANMVVASGSEDSTIKIWDVSNGKLLQTLNHLSQILSLLRLPNGDLISGIF